MELIIDLGSVVIWIKNTVYDDDFVLFRIWLRARMLLLTQLTLQQRELAFLAFL